MQDRILEDSALFLKKEAQVLLVPHATAKRNVPVKTWRVVFKGLFSIIVGF